MKAIDKITRALDSMTLDEKIDFLGQLYEIRDNLGKENTFLKNLIDQAEMDEMPDWLLEEKIKER